MHAYGTPELHVLWHIMIVRCAFVIILCIYVVTKAHHITTKNQYYDKAYHIITKPHQHIMTKTNRNII